MQFLILGVSVIACLILLAGIALFWFGHSLPEQHRAQITFEVAKPRDAVWAALTDYATMPQWWPAVTAVRLETKPDGEVLTVNVDKRGHEVAFRTKLEKAPARLVREIAGDNLPFGGTWSFELADGAAGRTRLTLTEDGFIKPPIFRGIARLFLKPDATMQDFAKHFTPWVASR